MSRDVRCPPAPERETYPVSFGVDGNMPAIGAVPRIARCGASDFGVVGGARRASGFALGPSPQKPRATDAPGLFRGPPRETGKRFADPSETPAVKAGCMPASPGLQHPNRASRTSSIHFMAVRSRYSRFEEEPYYAARRHWAMRRCAPLSEISDIVSAPRRAGGWRGLQGRGFLSQARRAGGPCQPER